MDELDRKGRRCAAGNRTGICCGYNLHRCPVDVLEMLVRWRTMNRGTALDQEDSFAFRLVTSIAKSTILKDHSRASISVI